MTNHPNRSKPLPVLAASLKAYRTRLGERHGLGKRVTQGEAAEELGVSESQLRDWEQRALSPQTNLARLAAAYVDTL